MSTVMLLIQSTVLVPYMIWHRVAAILGLDHAKFPADFDAKLENLETTGKVSAFLGDKVSGLLQAGWMQTLQSNFFAIIFKLISLPAQVIPWLLQRTVVQFIVPYALYNFLLSYFPVERPGVGGVEPKLDSSELILRRVSAERDAFQAKWVTNELINISMDVRTIDWLFFYIEFLIRLLVWLLDCMCCTYWTSRHWLIDFLAKSRSFHLVNVIVFPLCHRNLQLEKELKKMQAQHKDLEDQLKKWDFPYFVFLDFFPQTFRVLFAD